MDPENPSTTSRVSGSVQGKINTDVEIKSHALYKYCMLERVDL